MMTFRLKCLKKMAGTRVIVFLLAVTAVLAAGPTWTGLRSHLLPLNTFFYKSMPRLASEAQTLGWVSPPEEAGSGNNYNVLCPFADPSVCLIYDKNGFIAGMQFGIVKTNVGAPMNYATLPNFVSKTRFALDCFVTTFFFVDQCVLEAGGRASLDDDGTGTGLWLQNGPTAETLLTIPRWEKDMVNTKFTKEPCVIGQGRQYYYNMTSTLPCSEMLPMVALYNDGELHGFGFQTYGKNTKIGHDNWMEQIPTLVINPTLYDPPSCLAKWADQYNLFSLHVFFKDMPWFTLCPLF